MKQSPGSDLDRMCSQARSNAVADIIAHLRKQTGTDLGDQPHAWVQKYGTGTEQTGAANRTPEQPKPTDLTKEVLPHEDGIDRHWIMKSGDLIKEEHYLTAHGDLHFIVEYAKGVPSPQVDSSGAKEGAEAVVRGFWRNGKRMSVTPQVGEKANGQEFAWWPNGNIAREAQFAMGAPSGTWGFYDQSGKLVGEGIYQNGERWRGLFIGSDSPGADFLTMYPMKKKTYQDGKLVREQEFLKELSAE